MDECLHNMELIIIEDSSTAPGNNNYQDNQPINSDSYTESKEKYSLGSETDIKNGLYRLEGTKLLLNTEPEKDTSLQSDSDSYINERSDSEPETSVRKNSALQRKYISYSGSLLHGRTDSEHAQERSQDHKSDMNDSDSETEMNRSPNTIKLRIKPLEKGLYLNPEVSSDSYLGPQVCRRSSVIRETNKSKELDVHNDSDAESVVSDCSDRGKLVSKISYSDLGNIETLESEWYKISDINDSAHKLLSSNSEVIGYPCAESDSDPNREPGKGKGPTFAQQMYKDSYKKSVNCGCSDLEPDIYNGPKTILKMREYSDSESEMKHNLNTRPEMDDGSETRMSKSPNLAFKRKNSSNTNSEMSTISERGSSKKKEVNKKTYPIRKMSRRTPNIVLEEQKQADAVLCNLEEVIDFEAYSWSDLNSIIHRKLFSKNFNFSRPTTHALLEILSHCMRHFKGQDDPEVVETLTEILAALRLYIIDEKVAAYVVELPSFYVITNSLMKIIFTKEYSSEMYTKYVLHMFHNLINTGNDEQKKYARKTVRNHDVCLNLHLFFYSAYGQFYECCALMYSLYYDVDIANTDFASHILIHSTNQDLENEYLDLLVEKLVYNDFIYLNYYKMPTISQKAVLNFVIRSYKAQSKSRQLM